MADREAGGDILFTLANINKGRAANDATRRLAEVVRAVDAYGGTGKVTITVSVKPFKGGDGNVEVTAKVTSAVPQPDHAAVFFFDENGTLSRDDPSMDPLFARDEAGR